MVLFYTIQFPGHQVKGALPTDGHEGFCPSTGAATGPTIL